MPGFGRNDVKRMKKIMADVEFLKKEIAEIKEIVESIKFKLYPKVEINIT